MGVVNYRSTDASAPTLTGEVGSLINLLDKVLVDGYGSKAAAGWTKAFSATNKAAYRTQAGGATAFLRVDDAAPGAGGAREARVRGFIAMSDIDTGDDPFPSVAQFANGLFIRKSMSLDSTPRAWIVVADARTFILHTFSGEGSWGVYFGQIASYLSGDLYRFLLIARNTENSGATHHDFWGATESAGVNTAHFMARSYTGIGSSIGVRKVRDRQKGLFGDGLHGVITYPNPADGGLYVERALIQESDGSLRGSMRGVWHFLHPGHLTNGDTWSGVGALAGRTFEYRTMSGPVGTAYALETSDTWEASD